MTIGGDRWRAHAHRCASDKDLSRIAVESIGPDLSPDGAGLQFECQPASGRKDRLLNHDLRAGRAAVHPAERFQAAAETTFADLFRLRGVRQRAASLPTSRRGRAGKFCGSSFRLRENLCTRRQEKPLPPSVKLQPAIDKKRLCLRNGHCFSPRRLSRSAANESATRRLRAANGICSPSNGRDNAAIPPSWCQRQDAQRRVKSPFAASARRSTDAAACPAFGDR